ncbi:MAG TPA: hypothetical protein VMU13_03495 [Candidatus Paceibacterota bacterium]|nr:hypothetical protein [Candidatus Paceibacterota bacterium]
MEIGVPNSFIPHDATTPTVAHHYESSNGLADLLTLLAIVFFIASVALAVGSFLYLQYLNSESAKEQGQIQAAQAAFDPKLITQLSILDKRMKAGQTLLSAHLAPSTFFDMLDQTTVTTVSFSNLSFDATDPAAMKLTMAGTARDVNSIALQADLFGKTGVITNAIFSNIDEQIDGVHFTVNASVNPASLNYETLVTGQSPSTVNQLPASATPTTGTPPLPSNSNALSVPPSSVASSTNP